MNFAHIPEPLGSVVIPAHDEAGSSGAVWTPCSQASSRTSWTSSWSATAARTTPPSLARSSGHPVRVIELPAASKPAALRSGDAAARASRGSTWTPTCLPGVGGPPRAGATASRGGRRPTADPIRERRGLLAPVRSYYRARSRVPAVLGSLWGAGVYGLSEAAAGGSARSRTWWRTTSGWIGCSRKGRWRSSTARRSWSRCRAAAAISCGCSVVPTWARRSRRAHPISATARPETVGSTLRDLAGAGRDRPRRGARRSDIRCLRGGRAARAGACPDVGTPLAGERWERDESSRAV